MALRSIAAIGLWLRWPQQHQSVCATTWITISRRHQLGARFLTHLASTMHAQPPRQTRRVGNRPDCTATMLRSARSSFTFFSLWRRDPQLDRLLGLSATDHFPRSASLPVLEASTSASKPQDLRLASQWKATRLRLPHFVPIGHTGA